MGDGNNFFPLSYSKRTGLPSLSNCNESTFDGDEEGNLFHPEQHPD
jgi:hypothetical protein